MYRKVGTLKKGYGMSLQVALARSLAWVVEFLELGLGLLIAGRTVLSEWNLNTL